MTWVEIISAVLGLSCVFLAGRNSKYNFYVGYVYNIFLFVLFLYYPVSEVLISFVRAWQMVLGWTIFLEGFWIVLASIYLSICSRVATVMPIVQTLVRMVVYTAISIIIDFLNTAIISGFSYGGGS